MTQMKIHFGPFLAGTQTTVACATPDKARYVSYPLTRMKSRNASGRLQPMPEPVARAAVVLDPIAHG
jgi:hypothetical protein